MANILLREDAEGVAILTLNRPEKLNAISFALADSFIEALDTIETDRVVRAVVLTGAGREAFSAGADIPEFAASVKAGPQVATRDFVRRGQTMTDRIEAFPKPIIAAVNGLAFGGGCEIVEAAHLAVASERAIFAKSEIRLGMPPTFGGTQRLPRLVGRKRALELLLTGESFDADQALAWGLVNAVTPPDLVLDAALSLAQRIARHSDAGLAAILAAVARGLNASIGEGLLIEREQFGRLAETNALAERLDAWVSRARGPEKPSLEVVRTT